MNINATEFASTMITNGASAFTGYFPLFLAFFGVLFAIWALSFFSRSIIKAIKKALS